MTRSRSYFGTPAAPIADTYRATIDATTLTIRCAFCPFTFTGAFSDGRAEAAKHRSKHHPAVRVTRRRRGNLQRWNSSDDGYRAEGMANAREVAELLARRENEAA